MTMLEYGDLGAHGAPLQIDDAFASSSQRKGNGIVFEPCLQQLSKVLCSVAFGGDPRCSGTL